MFRGFQKLLGIQSTAAPRRRSPARSPPRSPPRALEFANLPRDVTERIAGKLSTRDATRLALVGRAGRDAARVPLRDAKRARQAWDASTAKAARSLAGALFVAVTNTLETRLFDAELQHKGGWRSDGQNSATKTVQANKMRFSVRKTVMEPGSSSMVEVFHGRGRHILQLSAFTAARPQPYMYVDTYLASKPAPVKVVINAALKALLPMLETHYRKRFKVTRKEGSNNVNYW